jgi:hypothetical protein
MNVKKYFSSLFGTFSILFFFVSCSKTVTSPDNISTHTIVGFVKDSTTELPILGASIRIFGSTIDTILTTNAQGVFNLSGISSAVDTIVSKKSAYTTSNITLTIGKELVDTVLIKLSPAPSDIPGTDMIVDISFGNTITDPFFNTINFFGTKNRLEGRFDGDTSAILFLQDNYMTIDRPLPFSHNFTACVWFNDFGIDVVKDPGVILENAIHDYGILLNTQGGKVFVDIKTDSVEEGVLGPIVRDGRWHFIAVVLREITERQTELRLFVDGTFVKEIAIGDADMTKFDNTFYIGGEPDQSTGQIFWPLRGIIDTDLRLYDRTLSQEELLKLYHEKGW